MVNKRRVMVDMSATILHHGHIRLLKRAAQYGTVVVGLTNDQEIINKKGYQPELSYLYRKEIMESIKYVDEVVSAPWEITEQFLNINKIDLLIHGSDNFNSIPKSRLLIFPRTKAVSSSIMRNSAQKIIVQINNQKLMLTPGPALVLYENIQHIKPLFGRGDQEYTHMAEKVINWVKDLSGQDRVIMAQGSSTFALELAATTFVRGNILLVSTGYYSDRLAKLMNFECNITRCLYEDLDGLKGEFDWVVCAYTETSQAFKVDMEYVRGKANELGANLYVDATGSIGLEDKHGLADVMAFSSCKGLFGLTGACFVAYKNKLNKYKSNQYYLNIETHELKMVTGPYHTIASLYGVIGIHSTIRERVKRSKQYVMDNWPTLVRNDGNQPLLCTYLRGKVVPNDDDVVLYVPRNNLSGSIICHLGEIYKDEIALSKRISISELK